MECANIVCADLEETITFMIIIVIFMIINVLLIRPETTLGDRHDVKVQVLNRVFCIWSSLLIVIIVTI